MLSVHSNISSAAENRNLQEQLQLPDWLSLKVEHRTRYEGYANAFKNKTDGGDQVLAFRTTVFMGIHYDDFRLATEFIDSRVALAGHNTPVNTTLINQTDLLQAYFGWQRDDIFDSGLSFDIKVGRQTMDVGSRRLVARNRFRNTLNNFTGIDTLISQPAHWHWRNFVVLPVSRLPNEEASLRVSRTAFDKESFQRIFAGSFLNIENLLLNSKAELYLFYLNEADNTDTRTKNRKLFTPGFRWVKAAKPEQFDFEIEAVVQTGTSQATKSASDHRRLNHFAYFAHIALGYSFNVPWQPQLMLQYDYASGDKDPNDGNNHRYETLYGARRFEYGPTGIWGGFARANINTPGIRLKFKPAANLTGFITHRGYWLAERKDTWVGSKGLRDKTGQSGRYIGQQMELRLRWKIIPKRVTLETGWAHLFKGRFAKHATGSPANKNDADYFYFQTSVHL